MIASLDDIKKLLRIKDFNYDEKMKRNQRDDEWERDLLFRGKCWRKVWTRKTLMNLGSFCNKERSGYAKSAKKAFEQRITTEKFMMQKRANRWSMKITSKKG